MRTRLVSSLVIVIVGVLATLAGGPIFALLLIALGIAGFREYLELAARVGSSALKPLAPIGYGVIGALGLTALYAQRSIALFAVAALAIALPLVVLCAVAPSEGAFVAWSLTSVGTLYLGLPVFAGVALRSLSGETDITWLSEVSGSLHLGWETSPRGLAWAVTVILAIWIGDSVAYLTGRSLGRHKLAPQLSPNKTVEGAVAGLLCAAAVGAVCFTVFGLGAVSLGVAAGGVIGIAGQVGDLAESFLKRQAGVKDSGALIPGHGGILDRIDALLFAFPAGLLLASGDQWLRP